MVTRRSSPAAERRHVKARHGSARKEWGKDSSPVATSPPFTQFKARGLYGGKIVERPDERTLLQLQNFLLFRLAHLFHLLNLVVSQLLNLIQRPLLFIFRNLLILERFFDRVISIAPYVSDGRAMLFQNLVQMFHHILA